MVSAYNLIRFRHDVKHDLGYLARNADEQEIVKYLKTLAQNFPDNDHMIIIEAVIKNKVPGKKIINMWHKLMMLS